MESTSTTTTSTTVIDVKTLTCWQDDFSVQSNGNEHASETSTKENQQTSKSKTNPKQSKEATKSTTEKTTSTTAAPQTPEQRFPVNVDLNKKLYLWKGEPMNVDVDCLVCPSNESLSEKTPLFEKLRSLGKREMDTEISTLEGCRTGEIKVIRSPHPHARKIIFTVGPKYHQKYKVAAENALNSCYRSILQFLRENHYSTVAIPTVHSTRRSYPPEEGVHIVLRTIRRFLEKYGDKISQVVLVLSTDFEMNSYASTAQLYFPRNEKEETAAQHLLPDDVGNEFGETVVPDREIRISAFPGEANSDDEESDDEEQEQERKEKLHVSGLNQILITPDTRTTIRQEAVPTEIEALYQQYSLVGRNTNLEIAQKLRVIQKSEYNGQKLLVIIGHKYTNIDFSIWMRYLVSIFNNVCTSTYSIVYFHTNMSSKPTPAVSELRTFANIFEYKFALNLDKLYVVHPTFSLKMFLGVISPFLGPLYSKMVYLDSLKQTFDLFPPHVLALDRSIYDFDEQETGTNWKNSTSTVPTEQL